MKKSKVVGCYNNIWSGEKGGVGKSWCAMLDAQRHVDRNIKFWLMDADKNNQMSQRLYPDAFFSRSVFFSEVPERASSANPILEAAIDRPVVTNCQAGTNDQILTWMKTKKVPQVAQKLGITLRYFFVSSLETDSLNKFESAAQRFSPHMPIIFVANHGCNLSGPKFFESEGFQSMLERYQAPVIHVGLFDLELRKRMEGHNPEGCLLNWGEAMESELFGVLDRAEIQAYLEDFYGQLDRAEGLADLAFAERLASQSGSSRQAKGVSPPPRQRDSPHGQDLPLDRRDDDQSGRDGKARR
ncbi:hypothetical protein [Lyngbya confervoides]|uniref:CobQ/CobB/MinD/ParA nucleotide binding domain-containing protein n=1 Tax=Lyngbya confervoides BDU141951 TaxID=1574623 RepID=A0ABD4T7A7_9CYAN|nr:hypothetical protein [Lyngbya confervoides]MCM1984457.1 hypothetical protein [Lyngbya confervoides BDU141951]